MTPTLFQTVILNNGGFELDRIVRNTRWVKDVFQLYAGEIDSHEYSEADQTLYIWLKAGVQPR